MGREIRRVPMSWQHPKDTRGHYIPLYDEDYETALQTYEEKRAGYPADVEKSSKYTFEDYYGESPDPATHHPKWDDAATMGYCYYENVSEGTPISPVFATSDELANWLVEHEGLRPEAAKRFVDIGWSPSMVMSPETGFVRGVDVMDVIAPKTDQQPE